MSANYSLTIKRFNLISNCNLYLSKMISIIEIINSELNTFTAALLPGCTGRFCKKIGSHYLLKINDYMGFHIGTPTLVSLL